MPPPRRAVLDSTAIQQTAISACVARDSVPNRVCIPPRPRSNATVLSAGLRGQRVLPANSVEFQRFLGSGHCLQAFRGRTADRDGTEKFVSVGQAHISWRIRWRLCDCFLEVPDTLLDAGSTAGFIAIHIQALDLEIALIKPPVRPAAPR